MMLIYPAGFERIIKHLIPALKKRGISTIVSRITGQQPTSNILTTIVLIEPCILKKIFWLG